MDTLMTIQELADYLKVSQATLAKWRSNGTGPEFIKVGGLVRYKQTDVNAYVNSIDVLAPDKDDEKEV